MSKAYLRHIFDQSDCQFNVGEIVEVIQPSDLFGYSKKEADNGKRPTNQQQRHSHPGDLLNPPLRGRKKNTKMMASTLLNNTTDAFKKL